MLNGSEGSLYDVYIPMGMTAENVAEQHDVSREAQDEWAVISQTRAVAAQASGHFDREIVPVEPPDGAGEFVKDDGPRPGTTIEKLAALNPVFKEDGTVTAGNACPLNDGAAAVLVMCRGAAAQLGLKPARGSSPRRSPRSVPRSWASARSPRSRRCSSRPACDRGHRRRRDQRGVRRADRPVHARAQITEEQLNPFGGAIALGHPFGMTGARIMTTLLNGLDAKDGRYGIESMCVAGGMGQAMLVERLS